jgi:hypothetical protein
MGGRREAGLMTIDVFVVVVDGVVEVVDGVVEVDVGVEMGLLTPPRASAVGLVVPSTTLVWEPALAGKSSVFAVVVGVLFDWVDEAEAVTGAGAVSPGTLVEAGNVVLVGWLEVVVEPSSGVGAVPVPLCDTVPEDPVPEDPTAGGEDPAEGPVPEDPVPEDPVPEDPVPEDPVPEDPVPGHAGAVDALVAATAVVGVISPGEVVVGVEDAGVVVGEVVVEHVDTVPEDVVPVLPAPVELPPPPEVAMAMTGAKDGLVGAALPMPEGVVWLG